MFATYYGGAWADEASDVCSDGTNIFLYGTTCSAAGISTPGTFQPTMNALDAFVVKISSTGNRIWGTYFGGSSIELSGTITFDSFTNDLYVAGVTQSSDLPVLSGHQMLNGGSYDYYLFRMTLSGMLVWSTYYGGSKNELGTAFVKTDSMGNIILSGNTLSTGQISTTGAFQTFYGGNNGFLFGDIFVVKFNSIGVRLWGTYCGGTGSEPMGGIGFDSGNNIYLYGETEDPTPSEIYPSTASPCAYKPFFSGIENQFILKLNPSGQLLCKTYIGTDTNNSESDLDPNNAGVAFGAYGQLLSINGSSIYISGYGAYPVTVAAFQTTPRGSQEIFISKLCINICESKTLNLVYSANKTSICTNDPIKFTPSVSNACDTTGYKFHWAFTGGTPAVSDSVSPTVKFSGAGNYDVKLVVTTLCKKDSITKTNYITVNNCGGCTLNAQYTKGTANCSKCGCKEWIMVNATGGTSPYSYTWPDGYDKRYKNALCPGVYNVIITDNNGCKTTVKINAP